MTVQWTFKQFKSATGERTVREWYVNATNEAKVEFKIKLKFLQTRPIEEWGLPRANPAFKRLTDDLSRFGEIRFRANNVQHRPIGTFTGQGEFTILYFATEKNNKFVPKRQVLVSILNTRKQLACIFA